MKHSQNKEEGKYFCHNTLDDFQPIRKEIA